MSAPTIEQELALVAQKAPGFATGVVAAIEAGRIYPGDYYHPLLNVGCFYGHAQGEQNRQKAYGLDLEIIQALGLDPYEDQTPVECLIYDARVGDTHETHQGLAILHTALQAYLPPKEQSS